jgi:hypothetical protein
MLAKVGPGIRFNEHMEGDGETVFRYACKLGFEGIVSKRLGSPYVSGRSRHWLRAKSGGTGGEAGGRGGLGTVIKWPFALINHEVAKQSGVKKAPASAQRGANQVSTRVVRYSICTPFRHSCGCSSPNPLID